MTEWQRFILCAFWFNTRYVRSEVNNCSVFDKHFHFIFLFYGIFLKYNFRFNFRSEKDDHAVIFRVHLLSVFLCSVIFLIFATYLFLHLKKYINKKTQKKFTVKFSNIVSIQKAFKGVLYMEWFKCNYKFKMFNFVEVPVTLLLPLLPCNFRQK